MSSIDKIVGWEEARISREDWREQFQKVVFTNGCFDIIHLGHIDYLEKAAGLGDKLIIGLNTDESISRLKGDGRPVTNVNSRSRVLAALGFVDMVVLFDEDTPYKLIETLKPDILVKGDDYLAENVVGADIVKENGGEVFTIPLVKGYSTSSIIDRIKRN